LSSVELVFEEETKVWELIGREFLVDREKLLEGITYDLETRESTIRTRLECQGIATQRWIKVEDRDRQSYGPDARAPACLYVGDSRFCHESFLIVPECLRIKVNSVFSSNT
jgi:hypothetical protein